MDLFLLDVGWPFGDYVRTDSLYPRILERQLSKKALYILLDVTELLRLDIAHILFQRLTDV